MASLILLEIPDFMYSYLSNFISIQFAVVAMNSPLEALCTLRLKNKKFDLILTDVHMPEMSGLELLKLVEEEFKLPVILMSADKDKGIMLKGLNDGAVYYFVKPISSYNLSRLWQFAIQSSTEDTNKQLPSNEISPVKIHDQHGIMQVSNMNNTGNNTNNIMNNFAPLLNERLKENIAFFSKNALKRPIIDVSGMKTDTSVSKKPKLVWTTSLHNLFLEAVNNIGIDSIARTFEIGQSSTQVIKSCGDDAKKNQTEVGNDIQLHPSQGSQTANQSATKFDQLPSLKGCQQEFPARLSIEQQQNTRDDGNLSNLGFVNTQSTTNNYVGLRISTNGELIGTLKSSITRSYENGGDNNLAKCFHESNYTEKIGAQGVNYEMNFAYNNINSFHRNSPLVDTFFGIDNVNHVFIPSFDQNASQQENSLGMSQDISSLHGIGDELRQLGIDIHVDQESFGSDFGFGSFDVQGNAQGSLFEGIDQASYLKFYNIVT
ncbi:hypothetical protein BVRB_3g066550 [Beta vulgaris subsp. vulgaris]|nr:hypothetical protein BVRB_3g066550 [Beta vulgaris subsp. vulgaris]